MYVLASSVFDTGQHPPAFLIMFLRLGLCLLNKVFGVVAPKCGCEGGGVVFVACWVLEEFQRSCCGIWCGRRSNIYCLSILRKCKNVLLC